MYKPNTEQQAFNNEEFTPNEGFDGGDGYPNCEGEPCDNVTADEEESGDISAEMSEGGENGGAQKDAEVWRDKYLRLSAEFDNYRKRTLKEKMELIASGGEDVIKALLPVLDDMDRALEAMYKTDDIESVRTGIELISNKLRDMLSSRGVSEIDAEGQELDTDLHDAVAKTPTEKKKRGKVVDVVQKGYKLKDKVIRHAKVVIGE